MLQGLILAWNLSFLAAHWFLGLSKIMYSKVLWREFMQYRLRWFHMALQGNVFCCTHVYACIRLEYPWKYLLSYVCYFGALKSSYSTWILSAVPGKDQEDEGDMLVLCVELEGRGSGRPSQLPLVLLKYFGKSNPDWLFLPWRRWEFPPVAQNGGIKLS